ncbi:MAG: polymerase sigma factor, sigma-70 family [Gemmatimonadetes bacterium]|nr:polymerase sigma factor, sigma-70 family [Gemmatimonadota bacterium]
MSSPSTSNSADLEQTFLAHLPQIERIIALQVRRHRLGKTDAEEFESWAKEQLIDNDYAVLRKFGYRSSLTTYLTTVLVRLLSDFLNKQWGRWRPSAAATRAGPVALQLEKLIYRDGLTIREAVTAAHSAHPELDERTLSRMAARLPRRDRREEVDLDAVVRSKDAPTVEHGSAAAEREALWQMVEEALRSVVSDLPPEDAVIVRMRFWKCWSIAKISRVLRLDQPALYPRIDQMKARLRAALEQRGINQAGVAELIDGLDTR